MNALTASSSPSVASQLRQTHCQVCHRPLLSTLLFSSTCLPLSAPCSLAVYSLPATVNSAFAMCLIVSHAAVPSTTLEAFPLRQPFIVGPGYSPVPFKVVSQITAGKFVNFENLLAENIPITEPVLQL